MSYFPISSPANVIGSGISPGQINFSDSTFSVQVRAPATLSSNVDFTLPNTVGLNNQVLIRETPTSTKWVNVSDTYPIDRTTPFSIRMMKHEDEPLKTSSTTYQIMAYFPFNGTNNNDNIRQVIVLGYGKKNDDVVQYRIARESDGLTVAESPIIQYDELDFIPLNRIGQVICGRELTTNEGNIRTNNAENGSVTNFAVTGGLPLTLTLILNGNGSRPEITNIDASGITVNDLDGEGFVLYYDSGATDYIFFWFDINNSGTSQPSLPGGVIPGGTPFEISTINTGDSDVILARKIATGINEAGKSLSTGINIINLPLERTMVTVQARKASGGNTAYIVETSVY